MAYLPAQQLSVPIEDYPNYFLKCFTQGTTTPLSMATNSTGGTLLAKAEISGGGTPPIGFLKTAGGAIFQPYLNAAFDAWLFPTAAEADANDTSNAIQVADNINLEQLNTNVQKTFSTVAAMVADTDLSVGDLVTTTGYFASGDGGNNDYSVVAAGTGTDDGGSFIDLATHQAKGLFPGSVTSALQFGAKGDGGTDDTTPAQALAAFSDNVYFPNTGSAYILTDRLLFTRTGVTVFGDGESHIKWTTLGAARQAGTPATRWTLGTLVQDGIRVEASSFAVRDIILQGPDTGFVGNHNLVVIAGLTSANRIGSMIFDNCEIYNAGAAGVYTLFADNIDVTNCFIHDCGFYGGISFSCTNVNLYQSEIQTIGPGQASNMYGWSFTHDTTLYSTDPNAGTLQAESPFCSDCKVDNNKVWDIDWEGIDFHGAYNCIVTNNQVFNTRKGIAVTGSSGAAEDYAGYNNVVADNVVDGRNPDGTTSGRENLDYGITIQGADVVTQENVTCRGNVISFKGVASNSNIGSISAQKLDGGTIADNVIDRWMGLGIYIGSAPAVIVSNNMFKQKASAAADTQSICIKETSSLTTSKINVLGNMHAPGTGTAAAGGFSSTILDSRVKLSGNDFDLCTTPFSLMSPGFSSGTDNLSVIEPAVSDTTPSLASASSDGLPIHVRFNPTGGNVTVTNFDDAETNQRIICTNVHASNTITIDRSNAALNGGANQVLGQFDTLTLRFNGTLWIQEAPLSVNS